MSEDLSIESTLGERKHGSTGLISKVIEALYTELSKRAKAATSSYSATGHSLQRIYFEIVAKNHQKYRLNCLVHEFFLIKIF